MGNDHWSDIGKCLQWLFGQLQSEDSQLSRIRKIYQQLWLSRTWLNLKIQEWCNYRSILEVSFLFICISLLVILVHKLKTLPFISLSSCYLQVFLSNISYSRKRKLLVDKDSSFSMVRSLILQNQPKLMLLLSSS